jgi:hypothetical protein
MCPEYRQSVIFWPVPKSKKELGSFLGRAGYYRGFLPHYSDLTADLNKAKTREQTPWSLTPDEVAQFHKLQHAFNPSESLSFPNYDDLKQNPLIMNLDFSKKGLSASISQNQMCAGLAGSHSPGPSPPPRAPAAKPSSCKEIKCRRLIYGGVTNEPPPVRSIVGFRAGRVPRDSTTPYMNPQE